jgi:hypothetical protein
MTIIGIIIIGAVLFYFRMRFKSKQETEKHTMELQTRQSGGTGPRNGIFPLTIGNAQELAQVVNSVYAIMSGPSGAAGIRPTRNQGGLPAPGPEPSPTGGRHYMGQTATGGYAQTDLGNGSVQSDDYDGPPVTMADETFQRCGSCDHMRPLASFRAVTMECNHDARDCNNC